MQHRPQVFQRALAEFRLAPRRRSRWVPVRATMRFAQEQMLHVSSAATTNASQRILERTLTQLSMPPKSVTLPKPFGPRAGAGAYAIETALVALVGRLQPRSKPLQLLKINVTVASSGSHIAAP